jgi:hypothetical protein
MSLAEQIGSKMGERRPRLDEELQDVLRAIGAQPLNAPT